MKIIFYLLILVGALSCQRNFEAPIPSNDWDLFDNAPSQPLPKNSRDVMEGVYQITEAEDLFNSLAAVKWSYTVKGVDTIFHLSFFCELEGSYFITEGRRLDSSIVLKGYWRHALDTETGTVRLTISPQNGAAAILQGVMPSTPIVINGVIGAGVERLIRLTYLRPLNTSPPFHIVAHRGGGRTSDLLPASENSIEIIEMAARLGGTGVEIDVELTKDNVPVLFHDHTLNERLIIKNGMVGSISDYTYAQLEALVRLRQGEKIPTLREALKTIIHRTPLNFVWLDIKFEESLAPVRQLQLEAQAEAAAAGRDVKIYLGIFTEAIFNSFKNLPNYQSIPSINELTPAQVLEVNSAIWAPRFTDGLQNEAVEALQLVGKEAISWTLDVPGNIQTYLNQGRYNGILSNYPSLVAFYYYAKP